MRGRSEQFGMSLMEVLIALTTVLILIGALLGVGTYIKTKANIDLTASMLETLCTALIRYYDDVGDFPFDTPDTGGNGFIGDDYVEASLITDIDPAGILNPVVLPSHISAKTANLISSASSAALFYFLDKNPSSRGIVEAISNSLITNKDDTEVPIRFRPAGGALDGSDDIDLPRYIDPWGTSVRYVHLVGTAFPMLTSAGPDKIFDTPDDITSK